MSRHTDMTKALSSRPVVKLSFFRSLGRRLNWLQTREVVAQAGFLGLLSLVVVILAFPTPHNFNVGDVSEYTIRADRPFMVLNQAATEMARFEAASRIPPFFVLDDVLSERRRGEAAEIFRKGRVLIGADVAGLSSDAALERVSELEKLENDFLRLFNLPSESRVWEAVAVNAFNPNIERQALSLVAEAMSVGIMDRPNDFRDKRRMPVSVFVSSTQVEYMIPSGTGLFDLEAARRFMRLRADMLRSNFSRADVDLVLALAEGLVRPNLKFDPVETEKRINEAVSEVKDVFFNIRAGEVIVREGSVITPDIMAKIKIMKDSSGTNGWVPRFAGLFIGLFIFFNASLLLTQIGPKASFKPLPIREQAFISLMLVLVALLAHSSQLFGASLSWDFDFLDGRTIFYAMPIPTATMIIAILFGVRKAYFMALFGAVVAAAVTPPGDRFISFLYCYNGAIVASWCLRNMNERGHLIPASFWLMLINCLTLAGLTLFSEEQWGRQTVYNFCAAAASGALSGIIASGMIPLVEMVFGFSTNFKLLELGNLDKPILRELMLSAPGTYHHSVIVGAMVEAAAEAIGANPHLAKVGAYYHDIGKMKKPLYFVENQTGENRHDTLAPSMSALILIGHVRDGVELARENSLPRDLIDIIEQHHGTSLMGFFYHKAKELRQEGQPEVNEGDYRYPGPRPRSKEAGLVMMADICEAATRSLSEPTPSKIKNMVRQLINQIFSDGQLDDCRLMTREISEVINTFTNILIGIYHHRVAYPGSRKIEAQTEAKPNLKVAPGTKSETAKEIYGHLPVESSKGAAH